MRDPFLDFQIWRDELLNDASGTLAEEMEQEDCWEDETEALDDSHK